MHPLTRQHRRAQLALRAQTLRDLMRLWPAFDVERIARTWPPFEAGAVALVRMRGRQSSLLAGAYYQAHRFALRVPGDAPPPRATPTVDEIQAGLRAMVGEAAAQLARARPVEQVRQATMVKVFGVCDKLTLDHGRDTITETAKVDPQAQGWARVASGDACPFCSMLASRGPVYKGESAAFEAHRSCGCTAEPVYSPDQPWPGPAREFRRQWEDVTHGLSGDERLRAFRRARGG